MKAYFNHRALYIILSNVACHNQTLDVQKVLGKHGWPVVNGLSRAVEDASQHVLGHGRLQNITCKSRNITIMDAIMPIREYDFRESSNNAGRYWCLILVLITMSLMR
jgi:hypothetical protein